MGITMEREKTGQQTHWEDVYRRRNAQSVSWYRPHLDVSLDLLREAGLNPDSRVIDVGGGASTLVDDLIEIGVKDITILDLSTEALDVAKQRLGDSGGEVRWIVGDLLAAPLSNGRFDIWHDRAVLHFLTSSADARLYAKQVGEAVTPGGYAVIGGFAPDGPVQCSGLPVARRSAAGIAQLLAPCFELIKECGDQHLTPGGSAQSFAYALLRRT